MTNGIWSLCRDTYSSLVQTRLILAGLLTLLALPYPWGLTLVLGVMMHQPNPVHLAMLAGLILLIIALTRNLSTRMTSPRRAHQVNLIAAALWIVGNIILLLIFAGELFPKSIVVLMYLPSSLWVAWAAWMFYNPMRAWLRFGLLAALACLAPIFPSIMGVAGLTGEARVNFAWRSSVPARTGPARLLNEVAANAPVDGIDLTQTTSDDYPQYLGPQRTGVLERAAFDRDWKNRPPREVWRRPVGAGWSSFAIVGDFVVTQEERNEKECVVCYRVSDGSELWVHSDAPQLTQKTRFDPTMGYPGPRATPTIAGGLVYTQGPTGILNCLEGSTGRPVWSINVIDDVEGKNVQHGMSGSPLVVDDMVIVSPPGNAAASLAAYNRHTGKRLWKGGRHKGSYGSPALAELAGTKQVMVFTDDGVDSVDLKTGRSLWRVVLKNAVGVNCSQPLVIDGPAGRLLLCTGYNTGSLLVDVIPGEGEGLWSEREVWRNPREMKTKFTTAVRHGDYIYGIDDGIFGCIELKSGQRKWKKGRYQHGQVLLAGDLLIIQAEGGDVVLVEANPDDLVELGRIPAALPSQTWNNPALAGRFLLVRNNREAACYELPARLDKAGLSQ
jgi:outer membrane protein assembly factor BamB